MNCAAGCEAAAGQYGLCDRCEHLLAGTCLGKKPHWRRRNAQLAAAAGQPDERAYQCEVCGRYHVGRTGGHTPELEKARQDVIRRLRQQGNGALLTKLAEQWSTASRTGWKMRREGGPR